MEGQCIRTLRKVSPQNNVFPEKFPFQLELYIFLSLKTFIVSCLMELQAYI